MSAPAIPVTSTSALAVQLLGVTVCGPRPIGRVHVPLHEPLLALYGRNGAGKTRVLTAVIAALRGERLDDSWGLVHVQVPGADAAGADTQGDAWRDGLSRAMRDHLNQLRGDVVAHFARRRDEEFDEGPGDVYEEVLDEFRMFTTAVVDEAHSPTSLRELVGAHFAAKQVILSDIEHVRDFLRFHAGAVSEITRGGHFVLRATGTRAEPRWSVYAAASADTPACADLLDQDRQNPQRGAIELPDVPDEALPDLSELADGEDLLSNSGFPWRELSDISDAFITGRGYVGPGSNPEAGIDVTSVPWPVWATVPVLEVASVSMPVVQMVTDETEADDVDRMTRERVLRAAAGQVVKAFAGAGVVFHPLVDPLLAKLTADASRFLRYVFPDAPELLFSPGDPNEWLAGNLPRWTARFADGTALPLRSLSMAQRRWASLSCALAVSMAAPDALPVAFLCDEPEAGLHRRAEAGLPDALTRIAAESGVRIAVATHSPSMLDPARVVLVHVTRLTSGAATARPMDFALREELERDTMSEDLGLTPADLLQMVRCFVIVEGKHDEVVLGTLLKDDLDTWSVVYPVGGAKQMVSLATAGLIWDFTDAAIVIVLDNIARAAIQPTWDKVQGLVAKNRTDAAVRALVPLGKLPGAEARWLQNLLTRAIRAHRAHRIRLETLSQPDVICYLPAEEFVPGKTWDELIAEWRESFGEREATNIKAFLTQRHGASFNTPMIERIAAGAKPDRELQALGARLRELTVQGSWVPPGPVAAALPGVAYADSGADEPAVPEAEPVAASGPVASGPVESDEVTGSDEDVPRSPTARTRHRPRPGPQAPRA